MRRHIAYLKYVIRHKWFVLKACSHCRVGLWQAVIHDWHKFLPSEWFPYASTFYGPDGASRYQENEDFALAWNLHQKRGKHHWQHWLITWDRGETAALPMQERYAREMVADWYGAGKAITGSWEALQWYEKNKAKINLHPETRKFVESLLHQTDETLRRALRLGFAI